MTIAWILGAMVLAGLLMGTSVGLVAVLEAGDPLRAPHRDGAVAASASDADPASLDGRDRERVA